MHESPHFREVGFPSGPEAKAEFLETYFEKYFMDKNNNPKPNQATSNSATKMRSRMMNK